MQGRAGRMRCARRLSHLTEPRKAERQLCVARASLLRVLVFLMAIAMSAIIEGNFQYTGHESDDDNPLLATVFATFEVMALSSLFLCLVCCLL